MTEQQEDEGKEMSFTISYKHYEMINNTIRKSITIHDNDGDDGAEKKIN